ncbi:MAG: hypothetical protein IPI66_12455 [Chitinophagaceae bacterium]|nr:hypothetical protein [Chitinophagaceae bacterium]
MCKKVIEKSAKTAGATAAVWDEDSKELKVTYASNKTNSTKIQQAIAKSGYDTQDFSVMMPPMKNYRVAAITTVRSNRTMPHR